MLDWTLYNTITKNKYPVLSLEQRIQFEKFFRTLENDKKGVCYPGGNHSHIIIRVPDSGMGIKVYKDNEKKNKELVKFHGGVRDFIYKDNERIQKVYECDVLDGITYARQEWIEGDTLKERYNKGDITLEDLNKIMDELYLKIIIPLWGEGLIWKYGCLGNLCYTDKLVMIDTDNMNKTAYEILEGSSYKLRNMARVLNRDAHLDIFYNLSTCIKEIDYYIIRKLWYENMVCVYDYDIRSGWGDLALEGFDRFKGEFNKLF